jgi:hypothetical protein
MVVHRSGRIRYYTGDSDAYQAFRTEFQASTDRFHP